MIGKELFSKRFTACISYCPGDKKKRNTIAFEYSVERIKGLPAMLFFNVRLPIILSLFIFKTPHFSSNNPAGNLHLSSKIYMNLHFSLKTLQNSKRFFNFIWAAIKKGENTRVKAEKFIAIPRGELKYLAIRMQLLTNDFKNYL